MGKLKTIHVGEKYGHWTSISQSSLDDAKLNKVKCQCSCGTIRQVKVHNLLSGKSKSCGCIQKKQISNFSRGKVSKNAVDSKHKAISELINSYKFGAKQRGLSYQLTRDQFSHLIIQNCSYCGANPSNTKNTNRGEFNYNGIDRIDNNVGYELYNVTTCCKTCNYMKTNMSVGAFCEHIEKIRLNIEVSFTFTDKKLSHYHSRALAVANMSHDSQTKVGALLINKETGAVMAEGYNGFIRGANDGSLPNTRPEKYDYIVHAETNLLSNAVRHGVSTNKNIIYCTLSPCKKCLRMLWQAGISTFYFKEKYTDYSESSNMLDLKIKESKVGDFYCITISPKV